MRHRVAGRKLGRTSEHRLALRRNMVQSLIEHETITTTKQKAKEIKPFAEKMITLAKKGTLASRRQAISLLGNRDIYDSEENKTGTVIGKLFSEIGPRFLDRPGGYTRIVKLAMRRVGDNGEVVLLQLLGENEKYEANPKAKTEKKSEPKPAAKEDVADKALTEEAAADESAEIKVEETQEVTPEESKQD